ncbi:MAG TPA: hypothetical protein VHL58_02035 [Thermoanaerobaculia bacterium]|nr:hypothetical protein [Thermoanaerobaculia bacterium]
MAALLYFLVASLFLLAANRRLAPISRRFAAALLLLPLLFTGRALLTGRIYAPTDLAYQAEPLSSMASQVGITTIGNKSETDVYSQMIPWRAAVRFAFANHEWPLWNPFMFCGDILAGAAQASPYYPTYVIGYLLPLSSAITFTATLSYFLAALGMFLFVRELRMGEEAAFTGAIAWAFSGFVIFFLETPLGLGVLLLPFVCFAALRLIHAPSLEATILLAFILAGVLLAGHPETALQVIVVASLLGAFHLRGRELAPTLKIAESIVGAGVLALGIAAIHLLPMFDAVTQTTEYASRLVERSVVHEAPSMVDINQALLVNVMPFLFGISGAETANVKTLFPPPASAYPGGLLLALAAYGLVRGRWPGKWILIALGALGCLAAAGVPWIVRMFYTVPILKLTLVERLTFVGAFALATLAAAGVETWLQRDSSKELATVLMVVAALISAAVLLLTNEMQRMSLSSAFITRNALIELLPIPLFVAVLYFIRNHKKAVVALFTLALVQRFAEAGSFYPSLPRKSFYPPIESFSGLPKSEVPFRIVAKGLMLIPNIATHYALEDVRGYQAMTFARFRDTYALWCIHQPVWFNRVDDLQRPFLSAMNVRYAVIPEHDQTPSGWRLVSTSPGMQLVENEQTIPRAFIPEYVRLGVPARSEVEQMYLACDFSRLAWIASSQTTQSDIRNGTGSVQISRRGLGYKVRARLNSPAWIVISETAWKGWRATIKKRSIPITFADHTLLAIHLDAGDQEVDLHYLPRAFVWGRAITALTLMVIVALIVIHRGRRGVREEIRAPG